MTQATPEPHPFCEPDERLRDWIVGGRTLDARRVVLEDAAFVTRVRRRIRWRLRLRQMLTRDQEHYREDAEHEALVHVLEEVFTETGLRKAVAAGEGFDPTQGRLSTWLLQRVDFKVRDWIRAHTADRSDQRIEDDVAASLRDPEPVSERPVHVADAPVQGLREALETLSLAERACLTVRYLPAETLTEADRKCVALYRRPDLEHADRALAAELVVVRDLLDSLWNGVQQWFRDDPARFEALNRAQDRVSQLDAQTRLCEAKQRWFRRRLREQGWSDERLEALAAQAAARKLKDIDATRGAARTEAYWFERWSCRLAAARELRSKALDALGDAEDLALPTIADVCRVLGKSESAVEPALSRARAKLRKQFFARNEADGA